MSFISTLVQILKGTTLFHMIFWIVTEGMQDYGSTQEMTHTTLETNSRGCKAAEFIDFITIMEGI